MGRTISSFRIALAMEKEDWKPIFRNALAKKDRKKFFDEMFDISRLYIAAYALIRYEEGLHTNVMSSILLPYNYKQLTK
jgi:hypothetical protein